MTAPLTTPQLTHLRTLERARMVDSADIVSRSRVSDNAGGSTVTTSTQSALPCYRQPNRAGNKEAQFGGQLQSGLQWLFAFPYDTAIGNDDEIVYGSERFAVMGTLGPRTYETAKRVIAIKKG